MNIIEAIPESTVTNSSIMPTEASGNLIELGNKVEDFLHLPVPILLMLALNGIAIIIRKSPMKNWMISLVIILIATVAYPLITSPANTIFSGTAPALLYLQGAILGLGSLGIDLFLEKFAWYRNFTKSISEDKKEEVLSQKVVEVVTDASKQANNK